jgi:RNA polymerase sigma-70 factor (ECF subfamily)
MPITAAAQVSAVGPSAVAALVGHEDARAVRTALAALSSEQREAFVLARYHGLPYAEIALTLGISTGAVKTRVFRAMEILKAKLLPSERDERPTTERRNGMQ